MKISKLSVIAALLGNAFTIHIDVQEPSQSLINIKYPINLAPRGDTFDSYVTKDGNVSVSDPYRFMEDVESNQTR